MAFPIAPWAIPERKFLSWAWEASTSASNLPLRKASASFVRPLITASIFWITAGTITMGRALRDGYRQKVFLMTKIDGRTKDAAAKQLDESLQRLQTDHIDLLQIHE